MEEEELAWRPVPDWEDSVAMTSPAPAQEPAVRALHATKVYGSGDTKVVALDDLSVDFAASEFSVIMGPSGSGKSTLMHCLAGLDRLTVGQVFLGGVDLAMLSDKELTKLRRRNVGFVFQAFNLVPTLTAKENITLPLDLAGTKVEPEWYDRVIDTIGLRDRLGHRPSELSGGQQQRTAIARALITRPTVIFADEPTGNLDSRSGAEMLDFMRQAVDELGQTIVMVTHDPNAAARGNRVVFLVDGRIVQETRDPTASYVLETMTRLGDG